MHHTQHNTVFVIWIHGVWNPCAKTELHWVNRRWNWAHNTHRMIEMNKRKQSVRISTRWKIKRKQSSWILNSLFASFFHSIFCVRYFHSLYSFQFGVFVLLLACHYRDDDLLCLLSWKKHVQWILGLWSLTRAM